MMSVGGGLIIQQAGNSGGKQVQEDLRTPTTLPDGYEPRGRDICCGRGKRNWNHAGNVYFRQLVQANVDRDLDAPNKTGKTSVVLSIVEQIRQDGAYFVKQNAEGKWYDIGDTQAREKVGHSLRDQVTALKKGQKKSLSPQPSTKQVLSASLPDLKLDSLHQVANGDSLRNVIANGLGGIESSGLTTNGLSASGLSTVAAPDMMFQNNRYALQNQGVMPGNMTNPHMGVPGNQGVVATGTTEQPIDQNPYGYENHTPYSNEQIQQEQLQPLRQFPTPLPAAQLQHYSSEPVMQQQHASYRRPSVALSDHGGVPEPNAFQEEAQLRSSAEVLERFARRPSWRAMSIASVGNTSLIHDIHQVKNEIHFDDDDEQLLKEFSLRMGAESGAHPERRSGRSSNRFSTTTGSSEDRRLSNMSMASLGGSLSDLAHTFRTSIRRSSVAWMQDVQEQFVQYDNAHHSNDEANASANRRVSALDMLKVFEMAELEDRNEGH